MSRKFFNNFFLITVVMTLLITSCAPKQFLTDRLPIGNWSVAVIKVAEGTSIEVKDADVSTSNGWTIIVPTSSNAIVKLNPTNKNDTLIRLARPGKDDCPNWAIGLFPDDKCEILEKTIQGGSK